MILFSRAPWLPKDGDSREVRYQSWGQDLYERLFLTESESDKLHGHCFRCVFLIRESSLRVGGKPEHE